MKKPSIRKRLLASLLSLSLLALATPGLAENRPGAVTISPYVGGYIFDHEQSYQNLETSPIFGIRAGYNFTENWGAEARFGYVHAESRSPNYPEADVYSYGIDALYHFNVTPNFVPFLAAGIGGMHHEFPAEGLGYYPEYAVNYGAGIKYFLTDSIALRGDVRHVILPDDELNNLEYTAGVTFLIGGERPAVVAAVAPAPDCPVPTPVPAPVLDTTAPTVSLTAPVKGATDADVDKHVSVAFSEPMNPATINSQTFTLKKGDTLLAGKVKNPSVTSASFTEADNLEPDTKYTATVTTGAKDLAGNALASDYVWSFTTAPLPKVVTKTETKVVVVNNFVMLGSSHFEFNKATLTPAGKEMLKQNVKILKDNPALRVRIAGHASAAGSNKYNQVLSEKRAKAARNFLVEEGGIASNRIETIGYGETRPAQVESNPADLGSAAAQANMRVVFEVIEK